MMVRGMMRYVTGKLRYSIVRDTIQQGIRFNTVMVWSIVLCKVHYVVWCDMTFSTRRGRHRI